MPQRRARSATRSRDGIRLDDAAESAPVMQPGAIRFGSAVAPSRKDEDRFVAHLDPSDAPSAFGVFDGHNGAGAASASAAEGSGGLCARILSSDAPLDPSTITDAFWDLDASLGTSGVMSGTTAQVLVCAPAAHGVRCALAWVGDSAAVHVDMSPSRPCVVEGQYLHVTPYHSPRRKSERQHLAALTRIRSRVDAGESLEEAAASVLGARVRADELALFGRALKRAALIDATMPGEGRDARRRAIVMHRSTPRAGGSRLVVVATATEHADPHYFDLAVSRSIGDWVGPDMVLPHPELLTFDVPYGQFSRVVLASDGLWDTISPTDAAAYVRDAASPEEAAEGLRAHAEVWANEATISRRARRDDVTVVVVDINPSLLPFERPSLAYRAGCGCLPPLMCKALVALLTIALPLTVALASVLPLHRSAPA